jgi:Fungal chitosanase of glycosyl hydrolase group 75
MTSYHARRLVAFSSVLLAGMSSAQDCIAPAMGGAAISIGDAVAVRRPILRVDADGAPNSYRVDGNGLSDTCDGVVALDAQGKRVTPKTDPSGWVTKCRPAWAQATASNDYSHVAIFGFMTDKQNRPVVQGAGDPLPGEAYISTSVAMPGTPDGTQRHYVDAAAIPYVVLPGSFVAQHGIKAGTVAVVYRKKTDKFAFAVYGDAGSDLGEASVRLHQDLGSDPIVRKGGVARAVAGIGDPVFIAVFHGNIATPMADPTQWNVAIKSAGDAALAKFGGIEKLRACAE